MRVPAAMPIFVVLRDGAGPFLERLPSLARAFGGAGVDCDIIALTESEARALKDRGGRFADAVFRDGMPLVTPVTAGVDSGAPRRP